MYRVAVQTLMFAIVLGTSKAPGGIVILNLFYCSARLKAVISFVASRVSSMPEFTQAYFASTISVPNICIWLMPMQFPSSPAFSARQDSSLLLPNSHIASPEATKCFQCSTQRTAAHGRVTWWKYDCVSERGNERVGPLSVLKEQ